MTFRPTPGAVCLVISGINAKTIATRSITTNPNMSFILFNAWLEATVLTGASTGPTFSIGTNATSYNNLISSRAWSPTTQKQYIGYNPANGTIAVGANTAIFINVTTGSISTTMTMRLILKGVYF